MRVYIYLAIWLMIIPFLGIPILWKNILVFATGLALLVKLLSPIIIKKIGEKPEN